MQLLDIKPGPLLRSAELSGWAHWLSSMCALMLPQTLAIDEALPTVTALIRSLSSVKPVVHLQFLRSGIAFSTDTTVERSFLNVGLIMCRKV